MCDEDLFRFVLHIENANINFLVGFDFDNSIGETTTTEMIRVMVFLYGEEAIDGGSHLDQAFGVNLDSHRSCVSNVNVLLGLVIWGKQLRGMNIGAGIVVEIKYR